MPFMFWLILFLPHAASLSLLLLFSRQTPFNLTESLHSAVQNTAFDGTVRLEFLSELREIDASSSELIVDYLYDENFSQSLSAMIENQAYIRMWGDTAEQPYGRVFTAYVRSLNMTRVMVISDSAAGNLALTRGMMEAYPELYSDLLILPKNASMEIVLQCVIRSVKPRGFTVVAIFAEERTAYSVLSALRLARLDHAGYVFMLSQEAAYFRQFWNGEVGFAAAQIVFVADQYGAAASRAEAEKAALEELLSSAAENNFVRSLYLYTFNGTQSVLYAKSPEEAEKLKAFQPLSGPLTVKATIRASVNYEVVNPDLSIYPLGPQMMRGFKVAFDEANNRTDLLPDYYLEDYSVSFTGMSFSYNLSQSRVAAGKKDLGLVYMMPPTTHGIIGMTKVFREVNVTIPIIAGSLSSILSDPQTYPFYLRPRVENRYLFTIIGRLVKNFGWRHLAVLYAKDNGDFEDGYRQLMAVAGAFGVNVTNEERLRGLPIILDEHTVAEVNASLEDIKRSRTRVVLLLHSYIFVVIDQMYDLGMLDDYVKLFISGINDAVFHDPAYSKRRKASKGALMFFPKLFIGQTGDRVKNELRKRDGNGVFSNTCFFYDAAYLYFYATDYLLEKGLDYEDPSLIVKTMRETYFHGCSGYFKIETGTNDRAAGEIVITNFQYDSEDDTYVLKEVGSYNPFSMQPYQLSAAIQWPDDTAVFADEKPMYDDCSFLEESVTKSKQSEVIGAALNVVVALAAMITVGVVGSKWRGCEAPVLQSKSLVSLEDLMVIVIVASDCLQVLELGPNLRKFSHFAAKISANFMLRFDEVEWDEKMVYWVKVDIAFGLICLTGLLFTLKFAGIQLKISSVCCSFDYLLEYLIPNLLFVPVVSTLSSTFQCTHGVSNKLSDSFLDKDCSEFCWQSSHLGYVVGSAIGLLGYIPIAILMRPIWQEQHATIHVKAQPMALVVKAGVQVALVAGESVLKGEHEIAHACFYFVVVAGYVAFMLICRQVNYDRLNLWLLLSTIALLLLSVCSFISTCTANRYDNRLFIAVGMSFLVLIICGVVLQRFDGRFESMLIREKNKDLRGLFTFAFTSGTRAREGLEEFYETNQISAGRNKYKMASEESLQQQVSATNKFLREETQK